VAVMQRAAAAAGRANAGLKAAAVAAVVSLPPAADAPLMAVCLRQHAAADWPDNAGGCAVPPAGFTNYCQDVLGGAAGHYMWQPRCAR
jgi:hypothetical protein